MRASHALTAASHIFDFTIVFFFVVFALSSFDFAFVFAFAFVFESEREVPASFDFSNDAFEGFA